MSGSFGNRTVKALKPHVCMLCGEPIAVGEVHDTWRYADGGQLSTVRAHPRCRAEARRFDWWLYDDWGSEDYPLRLSLDLLGEWEAFKAGGAV